MKDSGESEEESSSEEDDEDEPSKTPKKKVPENAGKPIAKAGQKERTSESSDEEESEDDSSNVEPSKTEKAKPSKVSKKDSVESEEESSSKEDDDEDEPSEGVRKLILRDGDGPVLCQGRKVTIEFTGYVARDFDQSEKWAFFSTRDEGQRPFVFTIGEGQAIKGFEEGILGMKRGEIALLQCTPTYAFGDVRVRGWVGPNRDVLFEVEII